MSTTEAAAADERVRAVEQGSWLRRAVEVWYAAFGGIAAWTVHLVFLVSAEHWSFTNHRFHWTLHAMTALCALATLVAIALSYRLLRIARGGDPTGRGDADQLVFLAHVGLLVGAINLALILLEGAYVLFIPRS